MMFKIRLFIWRNPKDNKDVRIITETSLREIMKEVGIEQEQINKYLNGSTKR